MVYDSWVNCKYFPLLSVITFMIWTRNFRYSFEYLITQLIFVRFDLVWFYGITVMNHNYYCRFFNAQSFLHAYIRYMGFSLVWVYGISTIVVYLISKPVLRIY